MSRPIIIETDIGRDPDDFFALCYLFSAGADIKAIVISPGDEDQVAVAKFLLAEVGRSDIPVGIAKPDRGDRSSSGGMHYRILDRYGYPRRSQPDGYGPDILESAFKADPHADLFVIGPLMNVRRYIERGGTVENSTMQGGFIGYDVHDIPCERLEKFEGKTEVVTFNLCEDKKGAALYLSPAVKRRAFIGKNLCHTIVYDQEIHNIVTAVPARNRADELLREVMVIYFEERDVKMFHDPAAAVAHLHPEVFTWVNGDVYYEKGSYGTKLNPAGDRIAVDVNREQLWQHIAHGT